MNLYYKTSRETHLGEQTATFAVRFTRSRYYPATYSDPAEGGEIEIETPSLESLTDEDGNEIDITPNIAAGWIVWLLANKLSDLEEACQNADEDGPDPDEIRDRRRDERLTLSYLGDDRS